MQHHANCQKPSGGVSPTLEYSTESNLAEVTEVRLECTHFSTEQIVFMVMWQRATVKHTSLFSFLFLVSQASENVVLKSC